MELREKTVASKKIFEGRVVSLRVDTVELPNGRRTTREIIEHKGAVAIIPMLDDQTLVLIRQYRQAAGRVMLEIPAGGLEPDETPIDCARRELVEEVGYYPGKLTELYSSYLAPGYSSEKLHTFLAQDLRKESQNTEADEFIEIVNTRLDDAVELIRQGEIVDAKTIAGVLFASRMLKK